MTATATVKHTPGIWKVGHAGTQRRPVVVAARAGRPVTVATFDSGNKDEDEANARLISAAPDMFEALNDTFDFLGGVDGASSFRAKILDVLSKAEGRAS